VIKALSRGAITLALLCFASYAQAEFLGAKTESISSQVLHQDRTIEVYVPVESSKQPGERFETLYVLDGDWNTKLVIEIVDFMRQLGMTPPVVVVSVPNYFDPHGVNSRDRDLTPSVVKDPPRSGGASDFLAFLKTELIPFVDQHYPTNGVHLVHGHSFGGLFLMYVLENEPQVFDGYLVLDPAMWWDNGAFKAGLHERLASMPTRGKAVYIAGREGLGAKDMGLDDLEPILNAALPPSLAWRMKLYADETHDSLKIKATYDALKFAYHGYTQDSVEVAPAAGIVLEGQPVPLAVFGSRIDLHYTTDGSEPTANSPRYEAGPIMVSDPGKTRLKSLSTRGVFDRNVPLNLKFGAALLPAKGLQPGKAADEWHYSLYPSEAWANLGAQGAVKPLREGTATENLSLKDLGRERVTGRLVRNLAIPADGYFILGVHASRARLRLGNTLLISNDGPDEQRMQSFIVPLKKGTYPLSIDFESATANPSLYFAIVRCADDQPQWWTQHPWLEFSARERP
jgi:predicted alpha/beta superfamily hydrolase